MIDSNTNFRSFIIAYDQALIVKHPNQESPQRYLSFLRHTVNGLQNHVNTDTFIHKEFQDDDERDWMRVSAI